MVIIILDRPIAPHENLGQTLTRLLKEVKMFNNDEYSNFNMFNKTAEENACIRFGSKFLTHNFTAVD